MYKYKNLLVQIRGVLCACRLDAWCSVQYDMDTRAILNTIYRFNFFDICTINYKANGNSTAIAASRSSLSINIISKKHGRVVSILSTLHQKYGEQHFRLISIMYSSSD